jgi:FkbM family methyltransferase
MLYRALKHVERGFYIDVGANHPVNDSVTKAFYDLGWRGINIEPNPEYFRLLQQERQEDINLNMAVGDRKGQVVFYEVLHTGLSTTIKAYADRHAKAGHEVQSYSVPCTTLDAISAEHEVDVVHFLNIDVEGAEKAVLQGLAFSKVRPWIVVAEANEPSSTRDVSQGVEQMLLSKGYECVYYDGLNRFYIAEEHSDLRVHFSVPPNFFDDYVSYRYMLLQKELADERGQRERLEAQLQRLEAQLQRVYMSWSWRLTAPLRQGTRLLNILLRVSRDSV